MEAVSDEQLKSLILNTLRKVATTFVSFDGIMLIVKNEVDEISNKYSLSHEDREYITYEITSAIYKS